MKRWQKVLLTLVALLLVLGLVLGALLGSTAGSRWLLGRVPGLQVEQFNGHLAGNWQAERLLWQDAVGSEVELSQVRMDWSPVCLLRATLCLELFAAGTIRVDLVPASEEEKDDAPFLLSDLRLPLELQLGHVEIGSLSIDSQTLSDIDVELQGQGDRLHIQRLKLAYQDYQLEASGHLQTSGDWQLDLAASLQMPPIGEQPWQIELTAEGALSQQLQLQASSSGYLDAKLQGYIAPLQDNLPASLRLTSERFLATPDLPATLTLTQLELTAEGNLADGYRLLGNSELPGEGGAVRLALDALLSARGATLATLELLADANRLVRLSGDADWQQALRARAELNWQDFPWQRLYPMDEPPVALRQLLATLDYQDGRYQGQFQGALDGPAGAFDLGSSLKGDLSQVELPDLLLVAGSGRIRGPLRVGFAEGISWDTELQVEALNPAYWVAELPGALAGPIRSSGGQHNQQLQWSANADLQGNLRQQPAVLQLDASAAGERLDIPRLELRLGDNRVHGQVGAQPQLQGGLELALNALGQLWPGLAGQLEGKLALAGRLDKPQLDLRLDGRNLKLDDNRIASLQLRGNLDARQAGNLTATLEKIRLGDTELGQLDLQASGDARQHAAELRLDGPTVLVQLTADGGFAKGDWKAGDWQGRLSRGRLQSGLQNWQLQQAASLRRRTDGRLDLGAHCWIGAVVEGRQPSLCAPAQRLQPDPQLNYRLENFALQSLDPWLPDDFRWDGVLSGELKLDLPAAGPIGHLRLDAGAGQLRIRDPQQWQVFAYQRLQLSARMDARRVESLLQFQSEVLGNLELAVGLDPRKADKPLDGRFRIEAVNIGVARPFVAMLDELEGRLDGEGVISGGLQAPRIDGQLRLRDGRLAGTELPTEVEQLQADILIAGQSLQLSGGWRGGEHGRASLSGRMDWEQALTLDVQLSGKRLPVRIEPYAQLEAEPDLNLRLADQQLLVRGTVAIPRGAIHVLELPPSTVKLSPDAQIVGVEREEVSAMGIAMDVQVLVGEDRLTFDGFGLTAEVAGQLHIGDNLDTRGELNLKKGRYRAYGQRLAIRRARLFFAGPVDQPYLDVEAVRRVDDVVAGLRLSGSAAQPVTQVFSEPAMSQEQALSYLVLGRPLGGTSEDGNMVAQAALALGLAGSSSITGNIARTLGIRDFELDTQGSGISTSVVASGRITDRLSLRYGVGVFEPANTFALRYELTRRLYLEAASGLASSLDLFYRRDF